jgi:hypothetical protein
LHRPPRVLFFLGTGKIQSFRGGVEDVSVAYSAFLADGTYRRESDSRTVDGDLTSHRVAADARGVG